MYSWRALKTNGFSVDRTSREVPKFPNVWQFVPFLYVIETSKRAYRFCVSFFWVRFRGKKTGGLPIGRGPGFPFY